MVRPPTVINACIGFCSVSGFDHFRNFAKQRGRAGHPIKSTDASSVRAWRLIAGESRPRSRSLKREQMAAHKIAHATLKGPSVVKEICIGLTLGLFAGGLWKMHHWNEQRKTRAFYDMLEKGEISG
ncbi:cytochrome c oxidase [Musa troglodytarum]|uniref:Cytochrome c oxidase n=1 Tax=Musa troglodytarum TaxID=320322 RepID=A0A9E7EK90_9LILI|nr:cytochrome c oxidase [Musa troglodytarum]